MAAALKKPNATLIPPADGFAPMYSQLSVPNKGLRPAQATVKRSPRKKPEPKEKEVPKT